VVHNCAPGVLAHVDGSHYVIACKDGCVALLVLRHVNNET